MPVENCHDRKRDCDAEQDNWIDLDGKRCLQFVLGACETDTRHCQHSRDERQRRANKERTLHECLIPHAHRIVERGDAQELFHESSGESQRGGQRWLKNEDLSTTPKPAKILAVKNDAENKFGPRVVLKLALDGAVIFWGVDVKKNPNYKTLEKRFGYEENNWAGQLILLGLELEEFSEQYNPAVTFPEPAKTARK